MEQISTHIKLDPTLEKDAQALFSDLGLDLSTAVTLFLRQSVREQAIPFQIRRDHPNPDTIAAMDEFYDMVSHPECYPRYPNFQAALDEVLRNA